MLDDILTLGKVESGKLGFEPAHLDVTAFCKDIVAEMNKRPALRSVLTSAAREIEHHLVGCQVITAYPGRSASNAIKYSSEIAQ